MRRTKKQEQENKKPKAYRDFMPGGKGVIEIPLYDDPDPTLPRVIMSKWRFEQLLNLGMTTRPRVNKLGYVELYCPFTKEYVRLVNLVADINSDQVVKFKDDNECNMVEDNLLIVDREPATWYRQKHLNVEVTGTYWDDIEILDKEKNKPRMPVEDPIAAAWAQNKYIQKGMQFK